MDMLTLWKTTDWKRFLLTYEGRVTRTEFWLLFALPYILFYMIAIILNTMVGHPLFTGLLALLALVPNLMVCIKRCHDRGKSGWFLLIGMIPLVNIWLLIELWFLGSDPDNQYGSSAE